MKRALVKRVLDILVLITIMFWNVTIEVSY